MLNPSSAGIKQITENLSTKQLGSEGWSKEKDLLCFSGIGWSLQPDHPLQNKLLLETTKGRIWTWQRVTGERGRSWASVNFLLFFGCWQRQNQDNTDMVYLLFKAQKHLKNLLK